MTLQNNPRFKDLETFIEKFLDFALSIKNNLVFDLKRLESYSKNLVDFHLIMDLLPTIAKIYFQVLPEGTITLSYV